MKFFFLSLSLIISVDALGNSCKWNGSISTLDKEYEFAFIGKVNRKMRDFSLSLDKFSVDVNSSYKGIVPAPVIIWSGEPSDCGAGFELGKTYVIFAKKYRGKLVAHYPSVWELNKENEEYTNNFLKFYSVKRP